MARMRHVGALDGTGHACVIEEEVPALGKGQVLVKTHASLVSPGTELSMAKLARKDGVTEKGEPRPFGYQNAGEVVEVGEGVTQFSRGDRVACMGAGHARHTNWSVVPQNLCARLPENVGYEEGAFAHLACTSLNALRRGDPELGEYLLVVGLGLVGQMAASLGRTAGMWVMGWDTIPFRCEVARGWGIHDTTVVGEENAKEKAAAFTRGLGFDVAIMAFGGDGNKALEAVRGVMKVSADRHQMGRVCPVSYTHLRAHET